MASGDILDSLKNLSLEATTTGEQHADEPDKATVKSPGKRKPRRRRRGGGQNRGSKDSNATPEDSSGSHSAEASKAQAAGQATQRSSTKPKPGKTTGNPRHKAAHLNSSPGNVSEDESGPEHVYVVQVLANCGNTRLVGVFAKLHDANRAATECVARYGIPCTQIANISGLGGSTRTAPAITRATRMTWANGTSEIRSSKFEWVKVLPKEWRAEGDDDDTDESMVYLAMDGSFVIGAYASKQRAWEACKTYWEQLSYWTTIEVTKWVDGWGLFHGKGKIHERTHHWFVAALPRDVDLDKVELSGVRRTMSHC